MKMVPDRFRSRVGWSLGTVALPSRHQRTYAELDDHTDLIAAARSRAGGRTEASSEQRTWRPGLGRQLMDLSGRLATE